MATKVNKKKLHINCELEEEVGEKQKQELTFVKTTQQSTPTNYNIEVNKSC